MSTPPGAIPAARPYKGPLSYEIEDAEYFFGRDSESDLLLAKILSSRFTLLHAQSGAGKTSLLNARVVPSLEQQCWTAFRILPRGNPIEALRLGTLIGLLPPPAAECAALDRTLAHFWKPGDNPTLDEILKRFDETAHKADPRRRLTLSPVRSKVEIKQAALSFTGDVRPLFLRLLRATIEISQYAEHLGTLSPEGGDLHPGTRASELRRIVSDPGAAAVYEQLLGDLYIPVPSLADFFANVIERYGQRRTHFGMVLILDQFEELFTLFADSLSTPGKQLWRLKWDFIEKLEELYVNGASLPIRFVLSMRDEYIAQLDPIRRFVRDLDASSFHLSFLEKEAAGLAIREPAKLFHFDYTEDCYNNVFEVLVREDRFVEPAPLQIVCEKLWTSASLPTLEPESEEIPLVPLPEGGARKILDSFFADVLNSFADRSDRAEVLEMLGPLVTANGTRNIVERDSLVKKRFRNSQHRLNLLRLLENARVVRIERRLGGRFVEISHEFLIPSILKAIREVLDSLPEYVQFRWMLNALDSFRDVEFRSNSSRVLNRRLFESVNQSRDRIDWEDAAWAVELMLRSAVVQGSHPDLVREWARRYGQSGFEPEANPQTLLSEDRLRYGMVLTLEELKIVNMTESAALSAAQLEFVLRSQLKRAPDRNRAQIVRWTKEFKNACDKEIRS